MPSMNVPYRQDMRFQSYGAFGELGYQWNDQNKLVTGVRLDRVTVEDERADSQAKALILNLKRLCQAHLFAGKINILSMTSKAISV